MKETFEDKKNMKTDYIKRFVEKDSGDKTAFSPMDPPNAYKPPAVEAIAYENMQPIFQHFMDEHKQMLSEIENFESTLLTLKDNGINREINSKLGKFFEYMDEKIVYHNLREERVLFPIIHDRMIDKGERKAGTIPETAVDVLENDHTKMMELITLIFSLLGIVSRLSDPVSKAILLDTAIEQGLILIERMRLHIFREDTIVFPLAQKYLTDADFSDIQLKMKKYFSIKLSPTVD